MPPKPAKPSPPKGKSVRINLAGGKQKDGTASEKDKPTRKVNMRRIAQLAKPIIREQPRMPNRFRVPLKALYYKPTWRIKNLAYPRWILPKLEDRMRQRKSTGLVSNVSPKALKYRATDRIIDLSLPRGWKYA